MRILSIIIILILVIANLWAGNPQPNSTNDYLPDSTIFISWEKPFSFSKTFYVNTKVGNDTNPGTELLPFKTINKAAKILKAGEKVVIAEGVYREFVQPINGGSDADHIISYEAAPGAKVLIKGSIEVPKEKWEKSSGWYIQKNYDGSTPNVFQLKMDGNWFQGYNPFGMVNVLSDKYWLNYKEYKMAPYLRHRGLVFVDGKPLEQVGLYSELGDAPSRSLSVYNDVFSQPLFEEFAGETGKYWIEHNGQTIHIRLKNDDNPINHVVEITTKEQVFAPEVANLGYIRIKGLTFEHAGNGFPVPQRGLVSTARGHHWIIEYNVISWANAVGLDVGNEDWNRTHTDTIGYHILRNNTIRFCGIEGIGGVGTSNVLVERNLFEWIGWQDAAEMAESAALKFHFAVNLMFRNNVIRHTRFADGVWLDINNINCRISSNVFADIGGEKVTADNGKNCIHIEGSIKPNLIDNNIFYDAAPGIRIRDTDKSWIVNNLFLKCKTGVMSVSGLAIRSAKVEPRPIMGFASQCRDTKIINNIFIDCEKDAIEFFTQHNFADGNVYSHMPNFGSYLRILAPEPQEWLDLNRWQEYHRWDLNGQLAEINASLDVDNLTLTLNVNQKLKKVIPYSIVVYDMIENRSIKTRNPGPIMDIDNGLIKKDIDVRKMNTSSTNK